MSDVSERDGWWQAPVNKWQPPRRRSPLAPDVRPARERLRRICRGRVGSEATPPSRVVSTAFRRDVPPLMSGSFATA
jgi:hypothetical protein